MPVLRATPHPAGHKGSERVTHAQAEAAGVLAAGGGGNGTGVGTRALAHGVAAACIVAQAGINRRTPLSYARIPAEASRAE